MEDIANINTKLFVMSGLQLLLVNVSHKLRINSLQQKIQSNISFQMLIGETGIITHAKLKQELVDYVVIQGQILQKHVITMLIVLMDIIVVEISWMMMVNNVVVNVLNVLKNLIVKIATETLKIQVENQFVEYMILQPGSWMPLNHLITVCFLQLLRKNAQQPLKMLWLTLLDNHQLLGFL